MQIKIALPKGRLLNETAQLLQEAGWGLSGYAEDARYYLPESQKFPGLRAKVFHEKDIPIQVAIGNYDLGICGLDWIEELMVKYQSSAVVKLKDLGYAKTGIYVTASRLSALSTMDAIKTSEEVVRFASEYPNLAESFALRSRLKRFNIFPVWGAAEAYPPENADLALLAGRTGQEIFNGNLLAVSTLLDSSAYLIANRESCESKDLSELLASLYVSREHTLSISQPEIAERHEKVTTWKTSPGAIRLALPDGHQQKPTLELLSRAGIGIKDYPSPTGNRRPFIDMPGVLVKVIRPQDMPLQVASGSFDLAITGKDWLREHLCKFPSSPVKELVDLKFGKVKIVAVVSNDFPVSDIYSLKKLNTQCSAPFRVASEYVNIADTYTRENQLGMYRVIPTWGATEAFLPDDADMLIENTQTGSTLARHKLKIIDTLFESTACLISNNEILSSDKGQKIESIAEILRRAVEDK